VYAVIARSFRAIQARMMFSGAQNSASHTPSASDSSGLGGSPAVRLWRAWQAGDEPELDAFVASLPDLTARDLGALVRVDLAARWQRSGRPPAEEYLRRFPAVAAETELALDVVYGEYLAREQAGERPELAEFVARFPDLATVLAAQIRLHDALDALDEEEQNGSPPADPTNGSRFPQAGDASALPTSYEIVAQIGSGGMGVVYKARHATLDRFVALKMLRAVDAGNPELLARIRAEARVVAALHHPGIVQVYDYGEHGDMPYIAMEYIDGGSLADHLNAAVWPPRDAAALLVKLADAVQFAHTHHVIHRDLKPANVLIAAADGRDLDIKITDFGLAKLCMDEATLHTRSFAFLGTPSYMAPEQAKGRARDLAPTADIYSLGAILYELLTGQPPFRGESPLETLRLLLSSQPVSIHRHAARISRDLATICDKCLQDQPYRRYQSAADLRDDLARFLDGRPIRARRIGNVERAWRWCRRNPPLAIALGSVATLLLSILCVSLWFSAQLRYELIASETARHAERVANQTARRHMWDAYLSEALALNNSRKVGQRFAALQAIDQAILLGDAGEDDADRQLRLRNLVLSSAMLADVRTIRQLEEWPSTHTESDMAASADCYVVSDADGTLLGNRISDGRNLWKVESSSGHTRPILSRDGRLLAAISERGTTVWNVAASPPTTLWQAGPADQFAFSPDGKYAACSNRSEGMRWIRVADGALVRSIGRGPARSPFALHTPTGRVAVCGSDSVQVISLTTGQIEAELPLGSVPEARLAWHPGGQLLAIWGDVEKIVLFDVRNGTARLTLLHRGVPAQLCFTDDGSLLASHSLWDRRLLVWDTATGQRLLDVPEAVSGACEATAQRNISFLINLRGKNVLTELTAGACRTLAQVADVPLGYWHKASINPGGNIAALSSFSGLELWDLQTGRRLLIRELGHCMAMFDERGRLIVGCDAGVFRLPCRITMSTETAAADDDRFESTAARPATRTLVTFGPPERLTGPIAALTLNVNGPGDSLVFQDNSGWAVVRLDEHGGISRLQTRDDPRISAASNDGRYVAIANWEAGGAAVWSARSGALLTELAIGRHGVVQFSPDGRLLAATPDGVSVWTTGDWQRVSTLHAQGTTPAGLGMAFSPDSRVLAVGQINGVLGLFDPASGSLWASVSSGDFRGASTLAFSPDQRSLLALSSDERSPAQVWDLVALRRELTSRQLDLPADVLRTADAPTAPAGPLEVILEGDQLFGGSPAAN
jgi:serine/threonine-protein kinase